MKYLKTVGGLLALILLGTMLAACGSGKSTTDQRRANFNDNPTEIAGVPTRAAFPLAIQRSDGKTLTIANPPSRIVSLSPGATETLFALGAEKSLVAVDKNADYPDGAKNFATKVDAYEPNIEAIRALNPDLVIMASDTGGLLAKLDDLKIPVLYQDINTDITDIDGVLGQIALLGQITGTTEQSGPLVQQLAERVGKVKSAVAGISSAVAPSVYHELDSTFYSASNKTFVGNIYDILHATNIAGDGNGVAYPQLTQEAIIAANPKVIVLADEAFGVTIDSVKARPGWGAIDAVKNNQVFAVDPNIISRPGPRIVDALETIAKDLYPSRFK